MKRSALLAIAGGALAATSVGGAAAASFDANYWVFPPAELPLGGTITVIFYKPDGTVVETREIALDDA